MKIRALVTIATPKITIHRNALVLILIQSAGNGAHDISQRQVAFLLSCQVRGLLTVSDRLSNRRLFGEMGLVPKVQLKASHCA